MTTDGGSGNDDDGNDERPKGDGKSKHIEDAEQDHASVQLDVYSIKVKGKPREGDFQDVKSWREAWRSIHHDLRSALTHAFSLIADTVKAARNLVIGVGGLPKRIGERIAPAHEHADRAEALRQAGLARPSLPPSATIAKILRSKLVQGYTARVSSNGESIVVLIVPPGAPESIDAIAATALSEIDAALKKHSDRKALPDVPRISGTRILELPPDDTEE